MTGFFYPAAVFACTGLLLAGIVAGLVQGWW